MSLIPLLSLLKLMAFVAVPIILYHHPFDNHQNVRYHEK